MKKKLGVGCGLGMVLVSGGCLFANVVRAQDETPKAPAQEPKAASEESEKAPSPWLLLPSFSNNPKLGTSLGALAGYVRKFDPQSQVSIFGIARSTPRPTRQPPWCSGEPRSTPTSTGST